MPVPLTPPYLKVTNFQLIKAPDTISINRQPAFSDNFELVKNRIFNDTNDFVISFRDTTWPKYNIKSFELFPVTKTEAESIESFCKNHLGEIVQMIIMNVTYLGIISDPNIEIVDEKDDTCNYKVSFTFETEECI